VHHPNARLTVHGRLVLCERVYVEGWTVTAAAKAAGVSRQTASKWVRRFPSGLHRLTDARSRPHRLAPRVPLGTVKAIVRARLRFRLGPHRLAWALGLARSTIYLVLRRCGLNRLKWPSREPVTRYEYDQPGGLIHLDVKKLGRIGQGGGKWIVGNKAATTHPGIGWEFVHVAVDDHSRLAYAEILPDEGRDTTVAFTTRCLDFFEGCGFAVERVLTDNGNAYRSYAFLDLLSSRSIRAIKTRPYHPQTNGKAEAFIRLLSNEWAYARVYRTSDERAQMLHPYLKHYNLSRPHGGLDGQTPISRVRCQ
jgi:transposase InsO family protein